MTYLRTKRIGGTTALFMAVVGTWLPGATAQNQGMAGMSMPGMTASDMDMASQLAGLEGEAFEVGFMSLMIAHHQSATEMAQWVLERTEDPEITDAARTIIDEQEAEIEQMTGWLQAWYDREPDAEMMGTMNEMMGGTMQTMMSSEDPERAFLEGMSEHHDGAIDMAQPALFEAVHPELRALAKTIIVAQTREIGQFQTWLAGR